MDIGSRDDVNSQQSAHINTPPPKLKSSKPAPLAPHKAARKSRVDTERMFMFNSALDQGKTPDQAADYVGVKRRPGESLSSSDIMNLKFRGTPPKTKKRL